jgi:phosphoribosyl 1,2-cyclic phosphodiesterase
VRVTFHGARGSTPVSGAEFSRYGGHTSCIAVSVDGELPTLVLDAGTGLQRLARDFADSAFRGAILLTHLHWDHVQGLPFFPPADRDDAEVALIQPAQGDPFATLARAMSPPHFPIGPDGLRGRWQHIALEPGTHDIGRFEVRAREVEHKGGRTYGYRVSAGGSPLAYVPDATDANLDAMLDLAADVDLLIRGAPFEADESARANAFGHGTVEQAIAIAEKARARRLLVTHHAPVRTDNALDEIAARNRVELVREGDSFAIGGLERHRPRIITTG